MLLNGFVLAVVAGQTGRHKIFRDNLHPRLPFPRIYRQASRKPLARGLARKRATPKPNQIQGDHAMLNKIILAAAMLLSLVTAPAFSDDEVVDCYYEYNAYHPACTK